MTEEGVRESPTSGVVRATPVSAASATTEQHDACGEPADRDGFAPRATSPATAAMDIRRPSDHPRFPARLSAISVIPRASSKLVEHDLRKWSMSRSSREQRLHLHCETDHCQRPPQYIRGLIHGRPQALFESRSTCSERACHLAVHGQPALAGMSRLSSTVGASVRTPRSLVFRP